MMDKDFIWIYLLEHFLSKPKKVDDSLPTFLSLFLKIIYSKFKLFFTFFFGNLKYFFDIVISFLENSHIMVVSPIAIILYFVYALYWLFYFFKFTANSWYYSILFDTYYAYYYQSHNFFFILNIRGYTNWRYFLKTNANPTDYTDAVRTRFLNSLDSVESRLIFDRVLQYLIYLNDKRLNSECYAEEADIYGDQLFHGYTMLHDLRLFYRSHGFYQAKWMRKYNFVETYNFFLECIANRDFIISHDLKLLRNTRFLWVAFITNLNRYSDEELYDKIDLSIKKELNISLRDLQDVGKVNFAAVSFLHETLTTLGIFNSNISANYSKYNFDIFLLVYRNFLNTSDDVDSLFICDSVISKYLVGVDSIIKCELDLVRIKQSNLFFERFFDKSFFGYENVSAIASKIYDIRYRMVDYILTKFFSLLSLARLRFKSNKVLYKHFKSFKKFKKSFREAYLSTLKFPTYSDFEFYKKNFLSFWESDI